MLKLIRLEWKKNNAIKYIRNAAVTSVLLLLLFLFTVGELENPETIQAYGKSMLCSGVDMFTNLTYILFTSVMIAAFSVSPYQNKTMRLLFSYPISRRKLLLAQIFSVWIFNFAALTLSKLLFYVTLVLTKNYTHISAADIRLTDPLFYADVLAGSAAMVSIGFLALPVGLRLKSSKAAIIAGLIIVFGTQGNIGSYSLMYNLPFYGVLLVLAFAAVALSVYPVEKKDVA